MKGEPSEWSLYVCGGVRMIYALDDCELDLQRYELRHAGTPVKIEPQVFNILVYLIQHRHRLVTKNELLERLWSGRFVSEATLTNRVMTVRKAIGDGGRAQRYIQTLHGRGYRFIAEVEERSGQALAEASDNTPPHQRQLISPPSVPAVVELHERRQESIPRWPAGQSPSPATQRRAGVPVVGRERELTRLHQLMQQALYGIRQVVFATGEAGLGKTTLVEAFVAELERYGTLLVGHGQCLEHYGAGEPYLPVLEALGRLCREPDASACLAIPRRQAPTWVVQMPWLVDDAELEAMQRRALGASRERMLREMAEAIEVLTAAQSLVLILEDLHWSDPSTLDLLAMLARRRDGARLLVLGTFRPAEARSAEQPLHALV